MIFMQNKKLLIRITAILLGIAFLFLIIYIPYKNKDKDKYNILASLNISKKKFTNIEANKVIELLTSSDEVTILYLGNTDKEYYHILETLYNVSLGYNVNKIYYYNIEEEKTIISLNENDEVVIEKEGSKFYNSLLELLGSFTEVYTLHNKFNEPINSGYKIIYTPMVLFIKNGKILYSHYLDKIDLNKEEFKELETIYNSGFKKISE